MSLCLLAKHRFVILLTLVCLFLYLVDHIRIWACQTVQCVGSVKQGMRTLPTFIVGVKLWLHSEMRIWDPFSWSQRTLRL
jgi:hypothetical protein